MRPQRKVSETDRERGRGVLHEVHGFGVKRRQRDTERERQKHIAVSLRGRKTQRVGGEKLAARNRLNAGFDVLSHTDGGEKTETDPGAEEFPIERIRADHPRLQRRDEFRHHEEPEEELNEERDVTEEFDPGFADEVKSAVRNRADDAHKRSDHEGEQPGGKGEGEGDSGAPQHVLPPGSVRKVADRKKRRPIHFKSHIVIPQIK